MQFLISLEFEFPRLMGNFALAKIVFQIAVSNSKSKINPLKINIKKKSDHFLN
jgi:hypothetical protein